MQQGDSTASYYQYYHSHLQNPNPTFSPNDPLQVTLTSASAPPFPSAQHSSDFPDYSSTYPPYPHNPDPLPNPPSSVPHLTTYYPYDQNQTSLDHASVNPRYNSVSYGHGSDSTLPNFENSYESSVKFDRWRGYFDENSSRYGTEGMYGEYSDDVGGCGVHAYDRGKVEPHGAHNTGSESSTRTVFDDYGRPIIISSDKEQGRSEPSCRIDKAVPKTESQPDAKSGVQKFRVKLLAQDGDQSSMDVLCQIGLDGIKMLDPAIGRTLRIYPLETVMRWEVLDSSIFAFWAKSSIDIEHKCIRLQSNSYTTNTILDTVTAATVQLKEMGGREESSDSLMFSKQLTEKKKGFADWMNLMKPSNEEKDHWVPDEAVTKCMACSTDFGAFVRKHHCRNCGEIFCDKCTQGRIALTADEQAQAVRVCDRCMAEVTQRLSNAREATGKHAGLLSHEDFAKKLKEEMDRNRKASSGLKSGGSGMEMREVACPTCTVHLQVQVPMSGSKTIECGVCQHPFLVNAH